MNRTIALAGLAGALSLAMLAAPSAASATCADRKMTGTVLGGVGGALIGNSISRGGGGAIVGGLGGAVVGHEIAASGCGRDGYGDQGYRSGRGYRRTRADAPRAVRYVYYDQYGDPVAQGPVSGGPAYTQAAYGDRTPYGAPSDCRTETQAYYDNRGALVQRPVQVCPR